MREREVGMLEQLTVMQFAFMAMPVVTGLTICCIAILGLSVARFRKQLG